jgi:hypothetical protein
MWGNLLLGIVRLRIRTSEVSYAGKKDWLPTALAARDGAGGPAAFIENSSNSGAASIRGIATALSGAARAVHGESSSSAGIGV